MKIGTIFKNIMYRALCIFQLSGCIFECSIIRRPLLGTNFVSTVWNLDLRGPLLFQKTCSFSSIFAETFVRTEENLFSEGTIGEVVWCFLFFFLRFRKSSITNSLCIFRLPGSIFWIRIGNRIGMAVTRASIMCLRGSRSRCKAPIRAWDPYASSRHPQ